MRPIHRSKGNQRDSLGGASWEFGRLAIDDHLRVGFLQIYPDERMTLAVTFRTASLAHCTTLGVTINQLIADNGSAYRSKLFDRDCLALAIKHSFTKPYRPQPMGKAERFIQTSLREWA